MNNTLVQLYHRSPYALRVLAASARGYYLRSWRYGPQSEQRIAEALARETWSPARWERWQAERLAYVLHRAATTVPYYREYWARQRRQGNRSSWEVLAHWPILTKEQLRNNAHAFVADDCDIRRMFRDSTSGTTGTPLTLYLTRETARAWYALVEARTRRWYGVSIKQRWAILGGQLVVPFQQETPPFWVFNKGLNQLYLSTHHLSPRTARDYVAALQAFAPTHLLVYPSSAHVLATAMIEQSLAAPQLQVVFSNAETLTAAHTDSISQAFRCPVRNTYGMGEIAAGASECAAGSMHSWPEAGILEVLDDAERTAAPNATGALIATGLINADMPLIRYSVGDRVRLETSGKACPCGRTLPILASVEGRLNDLVVTPSGRKVFWLNPAFYGVPVREAQIIQETIDQLRVRFIPGPSYTEHDGAVVVQRLHERVGAMQITLEAVDTIPRAANGKFRAIISHVAHAADGI